MAARLSPGLSRTRANVRERTRSRTLGTMSELPLDDMPGVAGAAHDAARGQVVYLTERGQRLAAIVPAEFAAALEGMTPAEARELLEDLADAAVARQALHEPGDDIPAEQVWAELGLS